MFFSNWYRLVRIFKVNWCQIASWLHHSSGWFKSVHFLKWWYCTNSLKGLRLRIIQCDPSGLGLRNIGETNSLGSGEETLSTPFRRNLSISTVTMSHCDWLNVLGRTLTWNSITPGLNSIFTPFTHCKIVGSLVISCQCGKDHIIWPPLNESWLESNISTSLIPRLQLNSWHTFVAEGLGCVRPALIRPPSLILSLEGGLWKKNHFLSVDMGGTSDCLEFPGLHNCSD